MAGSKFNSNAESNYAPIEGECLSVVKALHKCRHFVLGCKDLVVVTDHKPLLKVLGDRQLEEICNPRIFKLKEKTLGFSFKLIYVPGRANSAADAMSRFPDSSPHPDDSKEVTLGVGLMHSMTPSEEADLHMQRIALGSSSAHDDLQSITWQRVKKASLPDRLR